MQLPGLSTVEACQLFHRNGIKTLHDVVSRPVDSLVKLLSSSSGGRGVSRSDSELNEFTRVVRYISTFKIEGVKLGLSTSTATDGATVSASALKDSLSF